MSTQIKPTKIAIREYNAILTQTGTAAPIATVLHSTLVADPVWTRNSSGDYSATSGGGVFPIGKTTMTASYIIPDGASTPNGTRLYCFQNSDAQMNLTQNNILTPFTLSDEIHNAYIEIKVFTNE